MITPIHNSASPPTNTLQDQTIITAVLMKMQIFRDVTLRRLFLDL
jgi:hypothetical protein